MKTKEKPLPRYWKTAISRLTGLNYCDRSCDCGQNNELWWVSVPRSTSPEWVPGWMNGADTYSIWRWLVKNGRDALPAGEGRET